MDTWVISLAHRMDRLSAFDKRAKRAGLDYRVQVGVFPAQGRDGWFASLGALGCAMSHHKILTRSTEPVLIFEDDAIVPDDFMSTLNATMKALPNDWDVVLFGADTITYGDLRRPSLRQVTRWNLTHAYAVNTPALEVVAQATQTARWHWDHEFGYRLGIREKSWITDNRIAQDKSLGCDT